MNVRSILESKDGTLGSRPKTDRLRGQIDPIGRPSNKSWLGPAGSAGDHGWPMQLRRITKAGFGLAPSSRGLYYWQDGKTKGPSSSSINRANFIASRKIGTDSFGSAPPMDCVAWIRILSRRQSLPLGETFRRCWWMAGCFVDWYGQSRAGTLSEWGLQFPPQKRRAGERLCDRAGGRSRREFLGGNLAASANSPT